MIERIRELSEHAKKYARDYDTSVYKHYGYYMDQNEYELRREQKFAELIIRECAKFLNDNSCYIVSDNSQHLKPEELLQHFGIEQ